MSKGSVQRPVEDRKEFGRKWDKIFKGKDEKKPNA